MTAGRAAGLLRRFGPLALVSSGLVAALASGAAGRLSLAELDARHEALSAAVRAHPLAAFAAYLAVYVTSVGVSLPGAALLTLTGGLLFGPWLGALAALTGATLGSTVTFLACRAATGDGAMGDDRGRILGLMEGIRANAFAYILTVRLIPLVPLVPVNIAAGLARVPTRTFMLASFLGMAPCTVLYASVGAGLDAVFAQGQQPDLRMVLSPRILLPLTAVALINLAAAVRRARPRHPA
jgi:uncharacterized membrane protein YdjX (TVP38/TMEM64 family)